MGKNPGFRAWFYFRQGWSTYFAFIFAAINTLTVTYFLVIDNYPFLESIFPIFIHYIVIVALVGVPLLTFVGFVHFKKSKSHVSEQDVLIETSPHMRRILVNTEVLLPSYLKLLELIVKISKDEKLSKEGMSKISKLKSELDEHINQRQVK